MTHGDRAAARLAKIAKISASSRGTTRLPWTKEHKAAIAEITGWMHAAGLHVQMDAAGTLCGLSPNAAGKPRLLIGSHQDSVHQGGAFDGIMGIAIGCLVAEQFRDRWDSLPFAIEVLAFADEEGVRFPTALIGPRALAGTLNPQVFDMADGDGVTMRAAMGAFGCDPSQIASLKRDPASVMGFLEAHIEQGPVLQGRDAAVGIVTGICGISRYIVTVSGETGHAGTVPMAGRKDALVAASRIIAGVADLAKNHHDVRATVGTLSVAPGAVNAIPSQVTFTLEIRAIDDAVRDACAAEILVHARQTAVSAGCELAHERSYVQKAVACDAAIQDGLAKAAASGGSAPVMLASGATHDASAMADLCPIGMVFVRCRDGVSHRPDEHASAPDMQAAITVMVAYVNALATSDTRGLANATGRPVD